VVDGGRLGVEPICRVLHVALSTYYAATPGRQFTSIRYGERLAEIGGHHRSDRSATATTTRWPRPSTGYDNAELVPGPPRRGPWKTVEGVELATLGWVHCHNT